jgi:hypothetical protein
VLSDQKVSATLRLIFNAIPERQPVPPVQLNPDLPTKAIAAHVTSDK